MVERCTALVKAKDESRAKIENEQSSTDEIDDDIDDKEELSKPVCIENVQNSIEANEDSLRSACQLNSCQVSSAEAKGDNSNESEDSINGFEKIQNSQQIHSDKSTVNSDCTDKLDLDISVS